MDGINVFILSCEIYILVGVIVSTWAMIKSPGLAHMSSIPQMFRIWGILIILWLPLLGILVWETVGKKLE